MSDSEHLDRRSFTMIVLASVGGFMGLVIGIPAIAFFINPATRVKKTDNWIPAGPITNYPVNEPTLYTFTQTTQNGWERTVNSYGVYITKQSETTAIVFSNQCTHLACRVTWKSDEKIYFCPCHNGLFNPKGEVVSGPPPRPLTEYESKVEEGILYFYFTEA